MGILRGMVGDLRKTAIKARAGDAAAFDTLFERAMPHLLAFLRVQVGGVVSARESVHDLAQSVCREVLEDIDELHGATEEEFRNWLLLQARRKVLDRYRYLTRKQRDAAREAIACSDEEAHSMLDCYATFCTPSRVAAARDELLRVEAAIAQLPDNQREAVAMSRIMELDYAEIADRLHCTESAVRGLVARGLANLALLLE